jgi:hypothetical protein
VAFVSESKARTSECGLEMRCTITEKHGGGAVVFLANLSQEYFG